MAAPALAAALAGCAGPGVRYAAPDLAARRPGTVAVLPLDNESVSLRGPELVRRVVEEALTGSGWSVLGREKVDLGLQALGVTDGGQLRALDAVKLGQALGAAGLLYGTLEEFTYQNVGFLRRRAVRLTLKLVEARSGERLYEARGEGERGKVTLQRRRAGRSFVEGMVEQAEETALGLPLLPESREAVAQALEPLTGGVR